MTAPVPPAKPARSSRSCAIVLALQVWERNLFFTRETLTALLAKGCRVLEESELKSANWLVTLQNLKPRVLITGWRTPPLPETWLATPDCPLRYVCHVTGSVRHLVPRSFLANGGSVSNWGTLVSPQVAEHALLLALAALRNQPSWKPFIQDAPIGKHSHELKTRSLFGRQVGLHGFGSVTRALLPLLRPFGVTLRAYSTGVPDSLILEAGVQPCATLKKLFAASEILFECEALTSQSSGSVGAEALSALPIGAVFVNVGRGGLVQEDALLAAARAGRIRLALDVVTQEPLSPDSPFLALDDAILSPHIAGPTTDRYPDCGARALTNLSQFLRGEKPDDLIALAAYDRAT